MPAHTSDLLLFLVRQDIQFWHLSISSCPLTHDTMQMDASRRAFVTNLPNYEWGPQNLSVAHKHCNFFLAGTFINRIECLFSLCWRDLLRWKSVRLSLPGEPNVHGCRAHVELHKPSDSNQHRAAAKRSHLRPWRQICSKGTPYDSLLRHLWWQMMSFGCEVI